MSMVHWPSQQRRLPIGAELSSDGTSVHFRVWAPRARRVDVVWEAGTSIELTAERGGYFSGAAPGQVGALYRYRLDGGKALPDPASRFQPDGPHGPSRLVDPAGFSWTDRAWEGPELRGQIVYEMHVGTFTRDGTWKAAMEELPELAAIGVTMLEVMPIAEFAGRFGWGYDGVDPFAPTHLYGEPDDFRRFVDRAHAVGLAVILDVVYNHLGPDGNYLREYAREYFTGRYTTDWGEAINFDDEGSGPVREYFVANAGYWIDEYHLDGLRLDATQNIYDTSADHILAAIARQVRGAAHGRRTVLIAENEPQDVRLVRTPGEGGFGLDALWNDDFHHTAMVAATGRNEAYYSDHLGAAQEMISAVKWGYLFQGQRYSWQKQRRGTPTWGVPPAAFVTFLQNHDQVANSGTGQRLHELTSPGRYRALTALTLLAPGTPMLFQGQEFSASSPFLYFADHGSDLARLVREGRAEFLSQFPSLTDPGVRRRFADPGDVRTFERCKLDLSERGRHAAAYALHRDLLALRRSDAVFRAQEPRAVDGAVLDAHAFVLRFFGEAGDDRLLVINLGRQLAPRAVPEPLLAPPAGRQWAVRWSSEDPSYGGGGTPEVEAEDGAWRIPGEAAIVLHPVMLNG
jgi:maltooligosyltrehalose trehalohydrolase